MNKFLRIAWLLVIVCSTFVESQHWNARGRRQPAKPYVTSSMGYNGDPSTPTVIPKAQAVSSRSKGIAIGAWGYMAIILTIILSGMGIYQFILLYPIVCKKERKYDVMEMTTV